VNDKEQLEKKNKLQTKIEQYHKAYKKSHWWYCFFYYLCTYGSAMLSAAAATVIQLNTIPENYRSNLASIFASTATIFIAVSAMGDFQGHWRANRVTRFRLEQLANTLEADPEPNISEYVHQLNYFIGDWPLERFSIEFTK
jgi:nitrate/nitrite transporter NarK